MAVDSVIKFVLKQFAKRSARKTGVAKLLNETDPIVQSNARNIEIHLKNMGYDPSQMSTDDILKAMNYHRAMMNQHLKQQFKGLGLSKGVDDLAKKKDPFIGWNPRVQQDIDGIIKNLKSMDPMDAMKEANLVIGRKGKYKNLSGDEAQRILKKTDDHIFQRDIQYDEFGDPIKPDPEDLASGGRVAMAGGKILRTAAKKIGMAALSPTGAAGLWYGFGGVDPKSAGDRMGLAGEAAFAPELVKSTIGATKGMKNRGAQKVVQQLLNLGMPTRMALRVARVAQPLGLLALGGEGLYKMYKEGHFEKERMMPSLMDKGAYEAAQQEQFDVDQPMASGGIARVGFAGGLLARLYKGAKGLQHGAIERKLRKKYIETGMDKFKAYDKSMNEATNIVNQKKLKIVENKMNEVNVNSDDYVDLIDEHIRLTDRETYKDIKRWKNTRPDLADKTRALHFPHWAKARYGEDYHGVFQRRQALALKEQSDEINKMYPDTDGGIQDLQQRMVDEIDDMNKANIDEIIEGRKKNASGGIAGELHLNQGGRIGYATGTKKLGEGQYNPVGKGNWLLNMPEIDPRINPKWLKKKKRKGLAEILGV